MSKTDLLEKDIKYIQKDIKNINSHITNHIPTQIDTLGGRICELKKAFNEFKISQSNKFTAILVSIIVLLLTVLFK